LLGDARVFEDGRGLGAEDDQKVEVALGEDAAAKLLVNIDGAKDLVTPPKGYRDGAGQAKGSLLCPRIVALAAIVLAEQEDSVLGGGTFFDCAPPLVPILLADPHGRPHRQSPLLSLA